MKKKIIALLALVLTNSLYASWPMESVDKYNIVLVHGAADRWQGLDCVNGEGGESYAEAYSNKQGVVTDPSTCHRDSVEVPVPNAINPDSTRDSVFTECDTAYYNPKRIGGIIHGADTGSSATGMVKELFPFLNEELLESPYAAYLQRPFVNPAGSPANNADEIGKSNWMGSGLCYARRSLIEEAKEFKAEGSYSLDTLRNNSATAEYRTIPSRTILVGHSMGGVAIREYVQGPNYNKDVDKIVTLDSPHEGTGSLNMLLALKDRIKSGKEVAGDALWPAGIAMVVDPSTASLGLVALVSAYLFDAVQVAVDSAIVAVLNNSGGFDYYYDDPLADYIDPNKPGGVNDLISRVTPNMPMMRILGGEHSMVFTDPEDYTVAGPLKGVLPDEVALPTLNAWTFLGESGDKSTDYVNALAGFELGALGGVTIRDLIVC